jgi:hypothetical protein
MCYNKRCPHYQRKTCSKLAIALDSEGICLEQETDEDDD